MRQIDSNDGFDGNSVENLERMMDQEDKMNKELLRELKSDSKKKSISNKDSTKASDPNAKVEQVDPILEYTQPITKQPNIQHGGIKK